MLPLPIVMIPKHVVFLVNEVPLYYGNREYPDLDSNIKNFEKILQCSDWCLKLQIKEITVGMFSCITFKFPADEIMKMMIAFRITLVNWIDSEIFISKGISLKVVDTLSELPDDIRHLLRILQDVTRNNVKLTLNILIGHPGETHLRNLDGNIQSSEYKFVQEIFSEYIWPFTNEPQLIISNSMYRRITDYLIWKSPSRCMLHTHRIWSTMKLHHFLGYLLYFQFHQFYRKTSSKL